MNEVISFERNDVTCGSSSRFPRDADRIAVHRAQRQQGRFNGAAVFVPVAPVFRHQARGCNILIRDGALLVRSAKDITDALRHEAQPVVRDLFAEAPAQAIAAPKSMAKPSVRHALDLSRRILSLLGPSPIAEDQLIRELDLPAQTIASELVNLELEGKLARQSGGMLARAV